MTVGEVFEIVDRIAYLVEKCQSNTPLDDSDIDSIIDYLDDYSEVLVNAEVSDVFSRRVKDDT
jgi:hypothetical protein